MKPKYFDSIEFKRRAQAEIFEQIRGMTHEQELSYWNEQAENGPLGEWWKRIKESTAQRQSRQPRGSL
jgi:hypothetical protein